MKTLISSTFVLTRMAALAAVLALPILAHAKIVRTVEKTFMVQPGGTLKVATQGGDVRVRTGDVKEVHVTAKETIQTNSEKEADEMLEKLELKIEQNGNNVTAEAKYEQNSWGLHWGGRSQVTVNFIVTVPDHFNADVHTSGGDIIIGSLTGNVRAHTSGGDMKFDKIAGDIDASTSGGDVELKEGTARAKISTSGGDIHIDRAGGPTEVSTSGGDIVISSAEHLISARTSGGEIQAVLTGPLKDDCLLSTSGGEVSVQVAKGTGFTLDAHTSGGDVDASGITLTIDKGGIGKSRLVGEVNGGGPRLKVRASGGDITIRAK